MKTTVKVDLPERERLLTGLTLHEVHPSLGRAEEAAVGAERKLTDVRGELRRLEGEVAALPGKIHAGTAPAAALTDALRTRDAAVLMLETLDRAVAEARGVVESEHQRARAALEREVQRRRTSLERAAAELTPALEQLRELESALAEVLDRTAVSLGIKWPPCWADEIAAVNSAMSFNAVNTTGIQATPRHPGGDEYLPSR